MNRSDLKERETNKKKKRLLEIVQFESVSSKTQKLTEMFDQEVGSVANALRIAIGESVDQIFSVVEAAGKETQFSSEHN